MLKQNIMEKKIYSAPQIEQIILDKEISLALESNPPAGPNEGAFLTPDCLKSDPYKDNIS